MSKRGKGPGEEAIPTLTDVVAFDRRGVLSPQALDALQAELSARVLRMAEELVRDASLEVEAMLMERICSQLREQLPELIEQVIRDRLIK